MNPRAMLVECLRELIGLMLEAGEIKASYVLKELAATLMDGPGAMDELVYAVDKFARQQESKTRQSAERN